MKSILNSVSSKNNHKNAPAIKENITTILKENVAQIMVASTESEITDEGANDLCAIIEAIFLNGLKDGFMTRFRRTLDVDQQCTLSFWNLLMEISHQENIKQVEKLSTIKTEVGQCRAWIRIVLNEALLSSYLKTIKENKKTLLRYYHNYAFLLDVECVDIAQTLIEKVEAVSMKLPCNSGILNNWIDLPLSLAGIAYRPMRLNQIAPGVDIAQMLPTSSSKNSETCSIASSIISQSSGIGQFVSWNEDEALKLILKSHSDMDEPVEAFEDSFSSPKDKNLAQVTSLKHDNTNQQVQSNSLGNILKEQSGWSYDENTDDNSVKPDITETPDEKLMERSYSSLVESNFLNGTHIRTPDFRDVLQRLNNDKNDANRSDSGDEKSKDDVEKTDEEKEKCDEEDITEIVTTPTKVITLLDQVTILGNEKGLDSQDYKCFACKVQFSFTNKISVCNFTGNYFCDTCMATEEIAIPARIIYNWDYKKYPVSQSAFNCLNEIKDDPVVDFKTINPYIYTAVDEMARLQTLRNQLNYLRAYLYTCREPVIEELQKMMYPKEYMYEHIHQYSVSDLMQIKDGGLAQQLEKVVEFGRDHVLNCWLCSQKGFLCEFCDDTKPLFPFETNNVYRCKDCSGVSHKKCLDALKPCPRCKRKQERDLPLAEATTMD